MLITVCNSLHSLNIGSLPNSGHFLLRELSSFLTFWIRKSPINFSPEEIFTAICPWSYSKSIAFTKGRHFFSKKTLSASSIGHTTNMSRILAKNCVYLTLHELWVTFFVYFLLRRNFSFPTGDHITSLRNFGTVQKYNINSYNYQLLN